MTSAATPPNPAVCRQHPETSAPYVCQRCQEAVCYECCYSLADGSICCKSCFQSIGRPAIPVESNTTRPRLTVRAQAALPSEAPSTHRQSFNVRGCCVQHPSTPAVARCKNCGAGSCQTCNFTFPINLHYCPVCVTSSGRLLSPRRKKYLKAAYWLAASATTMLLILIALASGGMTDNAAGQSMWGVLFLFFFGLPATIGTAMGMSALRAGANPLSVWVALIWNAVMQGGMLLLIVIGSLSG